MLPRLIRTCGTLVRGIGLCAAAGVLLCAPADAQSLADIAAKEEARRKKVSTPSRLYTNKDVKPADRPEPVAAPAAVGPTAPEGGANDAESPDGSQTAGAPGAGEAPEGEDGELTEEQDREQQEKQWRSRMAQARTALERSQMFAQALQSRVNALWADFTARDDPAQRSVIEAERKKALAELDRVKSDIVAQTKAIADIEEEARRAGIPPGWLR